MWGYTETYSQSHSGPATKPLRKNWPMAARMVSSQLHSWS